MYDPSYTVSCYPTQVIFVYFKNFISIYLVHIVLVLLNSGMDNTIITLTPLENIKHKKRKEKFYSYAIRRFLSACIKVP